MKLHKLFFSFFVVVHGGFFLNAGSDEYRSKENNTLLHYAAGLSPKINLRKLLLMNDGLREVKNDNGETPIYFAIKCHQHINVLVLIQGGADLFTRNKNFQTPLQVAEETLIKYEVAFNAFENNISLGENRLDDNQKNEKSIYFKHSIQELKNIYSRYIHV